MSQEKVEIVQLMYDAFHGGDAERALAHFDPEVVVDATIRVDGGMGRGHDRLTEVIGQWLDAFDEWSEEIEEMRDLGDQVLVVATQRGRAKGTGLDLSTRYALLYEVQAGKITRMTLHRSPADALEAAGLSE